MPERPLLVLPEPAIAERAKKTGRGGGPGQLSAIRQQQRLGPKIAQIETAFEEKRLIMQTSAAGLLPEDVLVLETAGTVDDFFRTVSKIPGLEFLTEYDEEDIPPDDDFFVNKKGLHKEYRGRVYLMFSNQQAFRQLRSLWDTWQHGRNLEIGFSKWREVFALLRDIRPWSVRDRLEETGVLKDWQERLLWESTPIPCEIELWFRTNDLQRTVASNNVRERIAKLNGEVLSEAVIPDINYHALAVRLPIAAIQTLLDENRRNEIALVQAEQIQFFRASGQMAGRIIIDQVKPLVQLPTAPLPDPTIQPVVALLDGLPLQSHQTLAGRLSVEDPDSYADNYEARFRIHGTAMASLIIWGDLHSPGQPIPQPLYVRPIMRPFTQPEWCDLPPEERVSEGTLIVDLIHRAVRRMIKGDGEQPPSAPHVSVINLSIGIADRPFDGTMSPLARLLDWLSWKYNVLFLVSAGNHRLPIELNTPWSELRIQSPEQIHNHILKAVAADIRNRRLLSPAEGMNVLTIGALHEDADPTAIRPNMLDPTEFGHPSIMSAHGPGYKRSIKPEIFAPGGRVALNQPLLYSETELSFPNINYGPGQLVATPGVTSGDIMATVPDRGTSNATALMSRAAAFLVPMLDELRNTEGGNVLESVPNAVWLKALLVHGAQWGRAGKTYDALFRTPHNGNKLAEYITHLLGYGCVDVQTVSECTTTRVTALAGGRLAAETGAEHRFPLPPSLSGKRGWRRLVVTLAWMTPIHMQNQKWRRAHLWFSTPKSKLSIGSNKHLQRVIADWQAVQRSTVQHEVFEGEKAAAFIDGDEIVIKVSCREDAGVLTEPEPYALAVTLEVEGEIGIDIYTEIRERVQTRLRVAPVVGGYDVS